jgi:hypothetical protein
MCQRIQTPVLTSYDSIYVTIRVQSALSVIGLVPSLRFQSESFLKCQEVHVICGVDGLRNAINLVRNCSQKGLRDVSVDS